MSHLATWRGQPRVGLDHAVAAAMWAKQTASSHARAYAADVAVRAYVADGRLGKCREALDREHAALAAVLPSEPISSWWYFYDESFYWRTAAECALKLGQPEVAMQATTKSLHLVDPANLHNYTFRLLMRADALIRQAAIPEATTILGDVTQLTAISPSKRITERVNQVRRSLVPWEQSPPVRELDDRLAAYRRASANGSGNTNRTYSR
jgi:hypothetical protein